MTFAMFFDPKCMEKENAAKQTLDQLHERRKQVVRLHKKGIKIMTIAAMTGLSYHAFAARLSCLIPAAGLPFVRPLEAAAKAMAGCSVWRKCKPSRA